MKMGKISRQLKGDKSVPKEKGMSGGARKGQEVRKTPDKKEDFLRWLVAFLLVMILTLLFPRHKTFEFSKLQVGMVSEKEIIAPFTFHVLKSNEELQKQREEARKRVFPILNYDPEVADRQVARLDSFFSHLSTSLASEAPDSLKLIGLKRMSPPLYDETAKFLLAIGVRDKKKHVRDLDRLKWTSKRLLGDIYAIGVLRSKKDIAGEDESRFVVISKGGEERTVAIEQIPDIPGVKEVLPDRIRRIFTEERLVKVCYEVITAFLTPNLAFDRVRTEERKKAAVASVPLYKRTILANTRIIDSHQVISEEDMEVLNSLAKAKVERELRESLGRRYLLWLGRLLIAAFVVAILWAYLYTFKRRIYDNPMFLLLLSIVILAPVAVASYAAGNPHLVFLIPVTLSSMLVAILFDAEAGSVCTFLIAFLAGAILGYDFQFTFVSVVCGIAAVYSVKRVRHRYQFYRSMVYIPITYAVAIAATDLLRFTPLAEIPKRLLPGILNGFFSPVLTIGLLPIFESVFGITTDITLLELSDLNRPLLRDLAIKAPGTYNHSIIVGSLAEAAAEAIGANSLLARVGSYYHDIGKMEKPEYFTENQAGAKNPHDKLSPSISSLILASHIKEGYEMADRYGLPKAIMEIIQQHHGKSTMAYFYHRAVEKAEKGRVEEDAFRYPGPRPQTKEAAIVMLADSVEAAARTLKEKTPSRVKGLVKNIIESKFTSSELDECDLTLKELSKIGDSFLPILMGIYHARVEYPTGGANESGNRKP